MSQTRNIFEREELENILENVLGKTLGEVDTNNVFEKTKKYPKITGIAGDVIEQSVLGYPADSYQTPDLLVDGIDIELKTTGIRKSKKAGINYEAKEPMTITAVSPERIVDENFYYSNFWHKIDKLLFIYYLYDSSSTVMASEYARFPIKGYQFYEFDKEDQLILRNDWTIVRDFINELQEKFEFPEQEYHRISSELRPKLMMIDTAPKWPNRPRFRLKRAVISNIVQNHFGENLEQLPQKYHSFSELDKELHKLNIKYRGKTIEELISPKYLNIDIKRNLKSDVGKDVTEQIVTRMFGAKSKKISKIELFEKLGITGKTVTQTKAGTRTEDTKLFSIDFDEWLKEEQLFEDSVLYSDFNEKQFLFIIFEEPNINARLLENKFLGFKRIIFDEKFIEKEVRDCWNDVREKVLKNKLKEKTRYKNGKPIINKNGTVSKELNFPKSRNFQVFLRGTGTDSNDKPIVLNGISMYRQYVWVKGTVLLNMLKGTEFI